MFPLHPAYSSNCKLVIVYSQYAPTYIGYTEDATGADIYLMRAVPINVWPAKAEMAELATVGPAPTRPCMPPVDLRVYNVYLVVNVSPEAAEVWKTFFADHEARLHTAR